MEIDNRLSLQKLEIFCRVVELNGVGKAAEDLFLTQPVVSSHLKKLQERIGTDLFERHGRGLRLTEAGEEVYRWAVTVLRDRVELSRSLEGLERGMSGSAWIGASMSAGNSLLPTPLIAFQKEHPAARISMTISSVEAALEKVTSGWLDFAVVGTELVHDKRIFDTTLIGRPRFALAVSTDDHTTPSNIGADELAELHFVTPPSGLAIRQSQDAALAAIGVLERRVTIELGSAESIKTAVQGGLGACLLWRVSLEKDFAAGTLREVEIRDADLRDNLYLVKRRDQRLTRMQERLRDTIVQGVREQLDR